MSRRLCVLCAVMTLVCSGAVIAQRAPQTRPPVFFSESWKALPTPTDDHAANGRRGRPEWPARICNSPWTARRARTSRWSPCEAEPDVYPLNLWTGVTTSPIGATLRDTSNYSTSPLDPLAKYLLGGAHVRVPPNPPAHQVGRRDLAGRRPHLGSVRRLQPDRRLDCRRPMDEDRPGTDGHRRRVGRSSQSEPGRRGRLCGSHAR